MVTRAVSHALRPLLPERSALLVACSGGIDSCVLLDVLQELGWNLSIGHVNHGLRGDDSEADEAFVRSLGESRGIRVGVERVAPGALRSGGSSRERPTVQEAARRLRYAALERLADAAGAAWIATAHTADDQAETVLMRLLRGSGPDGLSGIPPRTGRVVRPLLGVSRRRVEAWAAQRRLAWREDASNASPAYTRNRVRVLIRQLEEEFNPNLSRSLGDLAEAQRVERAWLEALVEREAESRISNFGGVWVIEGKDWEALPDALARRLAREVLRRAGAGREVTRVHLERMVGFLRRGRAQTAIELPGGLELAREGGAFQVRAKLTKTKR
jgi:tRNA(Ile)-lysidine synthase